MVKEDNKKTIKKNGYNVMGSEVNRKAMIRNYDCINHNSRPSLNTKKERRTRTKFDKRPGKTRTLNRMTANSQTGGHSATLIKTAATSIFTDFLF